jgi:hypothetical protein
MQNCKFIILLYYYIECVMRFFYNKQITIYPLDCISKFTFKQAFKCYVWNIIN